LLIVKNTNLGEKTKEPTSVILLSGPPGAGKNEKCFQNKKKQE